MATCVYVPGHDRTSIALPGNQYTLATALAPAQTGGTPLLCVLMHGGSLKLGSLLTDCTAIIDAFFPGACAAVTT